MIIKFILFSLISINSLFAQQDEMPNGVKIITWNIQNIGKCKLTELKCSKTHSKEESSIITSTIKNNLAGKDIIFIQELSTTSSVSNKDIQAFVDKQYKKYKWFASKNVGTTKGNTERYLVLYNSDYDIEFIRYIENVNIVRSPLLIKFKQFPQHFITVHLSASSKRVVPEIQVIENYIKSNNIESFVVLGDFNAGCQYMPKELFENVYFKSHTHWISSNDDTTVRNTTSCAYDRLVSDKNTEFGNVKIIEKWGDTPIETYLKISDHYPVQFELLQ